MPPLRITFETQGVEVQEAQAPGSEGGRGRDLGGRLGFWLGGEMDGGASLLGWEAGLDHVHRETGAREGIWDERKASDCRWLSQATPTSWCLTARPSPHPHADHLSWGKTAAVPLLVFLHASAPRSIFLTVARAFYSAPCLLPFFLRKAFPDLPAPKQPAGEE